MQKTTSSLKGKIRLLAFLSESKRELTKVTWPTRQQIIRLSTIVVVASVAVAIYLGVLDYLFTALLGFILKR